MRCCCVLMSARADDRCLRLQRQTASDIIDSAAPALHRVTNKSAYLAGVMKRFRGEAAGAASAAAAGYTNPLGSSAGSLPPAPAGAASVDAALAALFAGGTVVPDQIDSRALEYLRSLPEHVAVASITELGAANLTAVRNVAAYFKNICKRHAQQAGLEGGAGMAGPMAQQLGGGGYPPPYGQPQYGMPGGYGQPQYGAPPGYGGYAPPQGYPPLQAYAPPYAPPPHAAYAAQQAAAAAAYGQQYAAAYGPQYAAYGAAQYAAQYGGGAGAPVPPAAADPYAAYAQQPPAYPGAYPPQAPAQPAGIYPAPAPVGAAPMAPASYDPYAAQYGAPPMAAPSAPVALPASVTTRLNAFFAATGAVFDAGAWTMLQQLPEASALAALEQVHGAMVGDKGVRNPSAYFTGIARKHLGLGGGAGATYGDGVPADGALAALAPGLRDLLESHMRSGTLPREKIDFRVVDTLARLSEEQAIAAIEEMARTDLGRLRNFSAYLMGICNKHLKG